MADVDGWGNLTPRQLWTVAKRKVEMKRIVEWEQTSQVLAMIHNALAKSKRRAEDFNPMAQKPRSTISARNFVHADWE